MSKAVGLRHAARTLLGLFPLTIDKLGTPPMPGAGVTGW